MRNNESTKVDMQRIEIDSDTFDNLIDHLYYGGDSAEHFFEALERQFVNNSEDNDEPHESPKPQSTYCHKPNPQPKPQQPKGSDKDIDDPVNHPSHYKSASGVECLDLIIDRLGLDIAIGFCLGNTFKYLFRCGAKGKPMEDVKKAHWYLTRFIDLKKVYDSSASSKCNDHDCKLKDLKK